VLNYSATNVLPSQKDQPLLSSKRRPHFQTCKLSWNEQIFGHGSGWGLKPRTALLVRASSSLLDVDLETVREWRGVA
jgi:hypothetical protein